MNRLYRMGVSLFISILFCSSPCMAQEPLQTVAVGNFRSPLKIQVGDTCRVSFPVNTLPPGEYTLRSCVLQFVIETVPSGKFFVGFYRNGDTKQFGYKGIYKTMKPGEIIEVNVDPALFTPGASEFKLAMIGVRERVVDSAFIYPATGGSLGRQPRLIFRYDRIKRSPADWGGARADGRHSNASTVPFEGSPTERFAWMEWAPEGATILSDPVVFRDSLYFVARGNDGGNALYAWARPGAPRIVRAGLPEATFSPLVDAGGHLYFPSRTSILVIDLNTGSVSEPPSLQFGSALLSKMPTLGPDGTLYLAMSNVVAAFTPFPEHRASWVYSMPGEKTSVTVNQEGTRAFVVDYAANRLRALQTSNGQEEVSVTAPVEPMKAGVDAPMMLAARNGSLLVPDRLLSPRIITVYNRSLQITDSIKGNNLSPLAGARDSICYSHDGRLFNWPSHADLGVAIPDRAIRSLVTDGSDNIFVLSNTTLTYVNKRTKSSATKEVGAAPNNALFLGTDGTVYVSAGARIGLFTPEAFRDNYTVKASDINAARSVVTGQLLTVPLAPDIRLLKEHLFFGKTGVKIEGVTIGAGSKITIRTGGAISFDNGFTVEQGATVSCQTGF